MGDVLVAFEFEFAQQVDAHKTEDDNPECQIGLAVKQVPVAIEVGHGEEFETEGQFEEGEHYFDSVEPAA